MHAPQVHALRPHHALVTLTLTLPNPVQVGVTRCGLIMPSASNGDGLILIKSFIPGDDPAEQESLQQA